MMMLFKIGSLALGVGASALFAWQAAHVRVPMAARLGHRGAQRRAARDAGGLFALGEPLVRYLAGAIGALPFRLEKLRNTQEKQLMQADYVLGLQPDELSALSLISSALLGASVAAMTLPFGITPLACVAATVFGFWLPTLQLNEVVRERKKVVSRGLPHTIEIVAMCMGAGLDFPGALRQIISGQKGDPDALTRELTVIVERLELGQTRKSALLGFAERVPSEAVRDFVNAVIQAEEKGNPLSEVIQVQGRILSTRRSVLAEEAAARAGVMLIGPMMLLVACIMLLLMGPFIVTGGGL